MAEPQVLEARRYKGLGDAWLEQLPNGTLSVLWRPHTRGDESRYPVRDWGDFEEAAALAREPWVPLEVALREQ
jgi:hypothetical protein